MAKTDPQRNYNFKVKIGNEEAFFKGVTGLKMAAEVIDYREGADDPGVRKLPGQPTFDTITLNRGYTASANLIDWVKKTGSGRKSDLADNYTKSIQIELLNRIKDDKPVKTWVIENAWISEYTISDLDATANDVLIEEIILQHEGFYEAE